VNNALIARAQAGDGAAFGVLFERYRRSVFRYLYYRIGDQHSAEDLTGEVFLRVMRALPDYRRQGAPFQAWIFQIARHLAVDHFRKVNTRHHYPLNEELAAKEDDLDLAVERRLTSDRLREALAQLTDEQREVITLRFVAEMPIAEVAAALSKSESAVKALQRRGLEALRDTLVELKVSYD
jgi:RNA polymerase sigma-70 factor (ECF subfamily)